MQHHAHIVHAAFLGKCIVLVKHQLTGTWLGVYHVGHTVFIGIIAQSQTIKFDIGEGTQHIDRNDAYLVKLLGGVEHGIRLAAVADDVCAQHLP